MLSWQKVFEEEFPSEVIIDGNNTTEAILEFTFNYPRKVKKFGEKTSEQQMEVYMSLIRRVREQSRLWMLVDMIHYFEYCKDGTVHMHGRYKILKGVKFYIEGLIQDFVKTALKNIDGRLKWRDADYHARMFRYRSPCMCVQYTDEPERVFHWESYIKKNN